MIPIVEILQVDGHTEDPSLLPDPIWSLIIFFIGAVLLFVILKYKLWNRWTYDRKHASRMMAEDILKQLYHVGNSGKATGITALAGALKLSESKAVDQIESMSRSGLIKTVNDTLELTTSGKQYALRIVRVHRLWEKYLSEKTGFDKSEWHDLAEEKEHRLNAEETERLYQDLGRPRFDPHGDPIPTEQGEVMDSISKPLPSLPPNTVGKIVHIEDEPEVIYRQIISKKLHIGSQIKITASNDHEIRFHAEGIEYELSPVVGSNISILPLSEQDQYEGGKTRLSGLDEGASAIVSGISAECRGANRRRLLDLGFIKGTPVQTEFNGPSANPKAYKIRNTLIALRNDQADMILIDQEP